MLAISTRGLGKSFGNHRVVDGLDLNVEAGSVFGFLGPNGAGKSTTMRMMLGLIKPDTGSVRIMNRCLATDRSAALRTVGSVIEAPSLYDHLSGHANLDLTRRLLALPAKEIERVLDLVDLGHSASRRVREYSLGMKQRLAIARALLGSPTVLVLDEPLNGLDPQGIFDIRNLIRRLAHQEGRAVVVSSHLLTEVEQTADHVGLLLKGRLVLQGSTETLLRQQAAYRVLVDDPSAGKRVAANLKLIASEMDDHSLILRADTNSTEDLKAGELARALVVAGLEIHEFAPARMSLEHLYQDAVRQQERIPA
ncbi:ATP-binding cassette domain-containing protein [Sphingomonas yabuuchiae]|uniref:ABC-2 type transport system ATP-binding protein n=1 Tax=Sphingomonas yabuuchiae TaxID=172044 RepID=A0AA40ZW25_9SPHN|nr:ATP-binding cassette domain-containing protein [Sphingomonas yabuuchiae]MBB4611698.1 ABC-2 type transport system ATP-binding protein [Sphingomonas yabuuchiae]MBN3556682.1 ATP-binding cassette domain-containing protein [Sphingomonas yabuuchiae]